MKKKIYKNLLYIFFICLVISALLPVIFVVANSFMTETEVYKHYGLLYGVSDNEKLNMTFIPEKITLYQYVKLLLLTPDFFVSMNNSVFITLSILFGQVVVSSMAAYAFARLEFKGRDTLFFIYIVTMLLPFQAIFVPNYYTLNRLGLLDTFGALIYPGIFSTFGVFLLRQFMVYIPNPCIEAAKIEGANHFHIFTKIILPLSKNAIAALSILVFIDYWNMIEQPLIFINDILKWPLSIYLTEINKNEVSIAFAASTIYIIPVISIFLLAKESLVVGIEYSSIKG